MSTSARPSHRLVPFTGIDRITLMSSFKIVGRLLDFKVHRADKTTADRPRQDRFLYTDDSGVVRGVSCTWNDGEVGARICAPSAGAPGVDCFVWFTPNRLLRGSNAHPANRMELDLAFAEVERRLREQNLIVDIRSAKVTRVEITRNIHLPRSVDRYWPLLHRLIMPYDKRGRNFKNGLWRGSSEVRLCIYGKRTQMEATMGRQAVEAMERRWRYLPGPPLPDERTIRLEWRLLRAKKIRDDLDVHQASDLITKFETFPDRFDKYMAGQIFRQPRPRSTLLRETTGTNSLAAEWYEVMGATRGQVGPMKEAVAIYGYDQLMDTLGWDWMNFIYRSTFTNFGVESNLWPHEDKMRQLRLKYLRSIHGIPYAQLYVELHRAATVHSATIARRPQVAHAPVRSKLPLRPIEGRRQKPKNDPDSI